MYGFGLLLLAPLLSRLRLVAAAANCSQAAYRACNDIADSVPDDRVTFPLDLSYETEQDSYWSLALRDLRAACIVFPETPEEAAAAIEVLAEYPGVPFTAKSGGHDPNVGHATAKGGVVISMARLTGTTYDADTGLAYVRPGGEWNDVIATLEEDGVTLVGGRLGIVGVAGYLLQGGISFLSTQYGLAADSIVGWEIVKADGSIVNVDAAADPDLAVALRGSGSQFGVVTQFTVKAHPIGNVWGGTRYYDASQAEAIYAALHNFVPASNDDPKAAIIVTGLLLPGGQNLFILFYFYDGQEHPDGGPLSEFLEIPSLISDTKTQTYADLLRTNGETVDLYNARISFRTITLPYIPDNADIYRSISEKLAELTTDLLNDPLHPGRQCSIDFQPLPMVIGEKSEAAGGNAMGLTASDPDRLILELQCSWMTESEDDVLPEATRQLTAWIEEQIPLWTDGHDGLAVYLPLFMNDAMGDQNVTGSYKDYAKFKALQEREDPDGMLSSRMGGYKY